MQINLWKTIALSVIILLIFVSKPYAAASQGEVSGLTIDSEKSTVTLKLDYDAPEASVVGTFTDWKQIPLEKREEEGKLIFKGIFPVKVAGIHEYKFIIKPQGGKEFTMNATETRGAEAPDSMFIMPGIKVYSSRNVLTPGEKIYLAAEEFSPDGKRNLIAPRWEMLHDRPGVILDSKGALSLSRRVKVKDGEEVTLVGRSNGHTFMKKVQLAPEDQKEGKYKIHYFRFDRRTFPGWNVWAWNGEKDSGSLSFTEETDFGKLAAVDRDNAIIRYSVPGNEWKAKETDDISLNENKREVFVVEGDREIYTDFQDAILAAGPKVFGALMDDPHKVHAYLSVLPLENTEFELYCGDKKIASATTRNQELDFNIPENYRFIPQALYEIRASKLFAPARVMMRNALNSLYYKGNDMGVTFTENSIGIRLFAPTASLVETVIYDRSNMKEDSGKRIPMKRDVEGTWILKLDRGEFYGKYYKFRLTFYPDSRYEKITYGMDPYANAVGINGQKGALIDVINDPATIPQGWHPAEKPPLKALTDSIIYELHVRDFSVDGNAGIKPEYKGKFMAFTQKGTKIPEAPETKTCLDHLKELGITHVHLLPSYDFSTVDEEKLDDPHYNKFNWGYDPRNYNVPEGSYSTDPANPAKRIREFRKMVQSLHNSKIRVIMDVVYNHTVNNSIFDPIVPGYYYRSDRFGVYTNGSGCGNEVASERPMVRKFITDSVRHWAKDYNVDGFRFDLMGLIDIQTMEEIVEDMHKIDPTIIVYGEPWTAGGSSLPERMQTAKKNLPYIFKDGIKLAAFNDDFRDAVRGGNWNPAKDRGYVTGKTSVKGQILKGAIGSIERLPGDRGDSMLTLNPNNTINYVAAHDNYVLLDQILRALGHVFPKGDKKIRNDNIDTNNPLADHRVRRQVLANGIILTSQGIPFIHAGDEMLRTKFGDDNSYKSGDETNRIRWSWKLDYKDVFNYYKGLIHLRTLHPAFRMRTAAEIRQHFQMLPSPGDTVAYILKNHAGGDSWKNIIVIYNPREEAAIVPLPKGTWHIVVDENHAGTNVVEGTKSMKDEVRVPAISMMVLFDKREKGE